MKTFYKITFLKDCIVHVAYSKEHASNYDKTLYFEEDIHFHTGETRIIEYLSENFIEKSCTFYFVKDNGFVDKMDNSLIKIEKGL